MLRHNLKSFQSISANLNLKTFERIVVNVLFDYTVCAAIRRLVLWIQRRISRHLSWCETTKIKDDFGRQCHLSEDPPNLGIASSHWPSVLVLILTTWREMPER